MQSSWRPIERDNQSDTETQAPLLVLRKPRIWQMKSGAWAHLLLPIKDSKWPILSIYSPVPVYKDLFSHGLWPLGGHDPAKPSEAKLCLFTERCQSCPIIDIKHNEKERLVFIKLPWQQVLWHLQKSCFQAYEKKHWLGRNRWLASGSDTHGNGLFDFQLWFQTEASANANPERQQWCLK